MPQQHYFVRGIALFETIVLAEQEITKITTTMCILPTVITKLESSLELVKQTALVDKVMQSVVPVSKISFEPTGLTFLYV